MDAQTQTVLSRLREESGGRVILGFSGGKDSLVCLDLLHRQKFDVLGMYWYLVPGLEVVERWFRWAKARYGLEVVQVPHPNVVISMREGIYTPITSLAWESLPGTYRLRDATEIVRRKTGRKWCVLGNRITDSLERRATISSCHGMDFSGFWAFPIGTWKPKEVRDYLTLRHIPRPERLTGSGGVSLQPKEIFHLYDHHRGDYERVKLVFPGVEALIKRREFYPDAVAPKRRRRQVSGQA